MDKVTVERKLLAQHVAEIDSWNASMEKILGKQEGYMWKSLEDLRAILNKPAGETRVGECACGSSEPHAATMGCMKAYSDSLRQNKPLVLPKPSTERNSTGLLTNYAVGWNDFLKELIKLNPQLAGLYEKQAGASNLRRQQ